MNGGGSSSSSSGIDVWPLVSAFIEKQRNEDKSVDDVLHSLGLDLICADRNVETRWALAALAAAQCRARLAPRTVPDAGSLERVIDLYAEVSDCRLQLGMAQQQLHSAQVLSAPVDQRRLRPAHRMRPTVGAVQAQLVDPVPENPGVLAGAEVR